MHPRQPKRLQNRGEESSTCAKGIAPKKEAPKRKKVVPPTPAMQPESAPPLWQLSMMIGQKTAEKYLQIAMDKKQRTVSRRRSRTRECDPRGLVYLPQRRTSDPIYPYQGRLGLEGSKARTRSLAPRLCSP